MASVTDTRELQRAWEAVPNYAVVQVMHTNTNYRRILWWRCDGHGKVFADSGEDWRTARDAQGKLTPSWWLWKTDNREVQDFVIVARDVTPDLDDAEIQRRVGWPRGLEVSRVA